VEAIEVYRGAAEVPAQFGPESCGAVVLWTRQQAPEAMAGSTWKKAAMAVGIVVMILLMRS
jgi:outer membrane receptor for Fe3+-dicitrate